MHLLHYLKWKLCKCNCKPGWHTHFYFCLEMSAIANMKINNWMDLNDIKSHFHCICIESSNIYLLLHNIHCILEEPGEKQQPLKGVDYPIMFHLYCTVLPGNNMEHNSNIVISKNRWEMTKTDSPLFILLLPIGNRQLSSNWWLAGCALFVGIMS